MFLGLAYETKIKPGGFEGVEKSDLNGCNCQKNNFTLTAVEVANPDHVDMALKHNVDVLWIGA